MKRWSGSQAGAWIVRVGLVVMPVLYVPGLSVDTPRLILLQVICFGLALSCFTARRFYLPRNTPFVLPLLAYLFLTSLQSVRGINPSEALITLSTHVGYGIVALGAAALVPPTQTLSLLRFSAIGGLCVSVIGILEHFGVGWALYPSAGRPSATFGFRNVAAMYLAVNIPLSASLFLRDKKRDWLLGVGAIACMSAFLVLTRSRGAWLGISTAACTGLALAWFCGKREGGSILSLLWRRLTRQKFTAAFVLLCLVVLVSLTPARYTDLSLHRLDEKKVGIGSTVSSLAKPGADRGRLNIWWHTLEMIQENLLTGVGLQNWSVYYPVYDQGDVLVLGSAPRRPHNDFLWIWSELGTPGLALFIWLLWAVGVQVFQKLNRGEEEDRILALFMMAGLLSLLCHSFFSFPRSEVGPSFVFWVALGLAGRPMRSYDYARSASGMWVRTSAAVGAVAVLVGIFLCVKMVGFERHLTRAFEAQHNGESAQQEAEALRAMEAGRFDHRVYLLLGEAKSAQGDNEGARSVYEAYRALQPYLPAVYNNLGRTEAALGDYQAAERSYLKGLEIFPEDGTLLNNLAAVFKETGEIDRALKIYEDRSAWSAAAHHNMGLIYAERGALDQALKGYQKALQLDPKMFEVYYSLGGLYIYMEDYPSSADAYESFLEVWKGHPAYIRRAQKRLKQVYPILGDAYASEGNLSGAEAAYRRLESLGGSSPQVYNNLAIIHRRMGNRPAAHASCRKAIRMDSSFAQAYFTLAGLLEEDGDREGALRAYRTFENLWPEDDEFARRAHRRAMALRR